MKVPQFYGKDITDLNKDEQQLLNIDNFLLLSFRMREENRTIKLGNLEIGSERGISNLSKDRYKLTLKLLDMNEDTECSKVIMEMLEDTRYSFQRFLRDYMKLGNLVSQFIDEKLVRNENEFGKICLN